MAYNTLTKIGAFGVCLDVGTDHLCVSAYVPDKMVMIYRSLHTSNLEDTIVILRDLVERGVEGDPINALAKKRLRTVANVLEFHRPVFEQQASTEFNDIAAKCMIRLMGNRRLKVMYLRKAKLAMEDFVRESASHYRVNDPLTPPWRT